MYKMDEKYMKQAIDVALKGIIDGGGPFGAVIVDKDGNVLACEHNNVTNTNDPTAHAEVVCIRQACKKLDTFTLNGCTLYTSCEPCGMCFAAAMWAHVDKIVYGNTRVDAKNAGFDDEHIYQELSKPLEERQVPFLQCLAEESKITFDTWNNKIDKIRY
jgi:tRNA(Arg) A34 adenosine deaminase TadA